MDPYENNNLSPLDKKKMKDAAQKVEVAVEEAEEVMEHMEDELSSVSAPSNGQESWVDHLSDLRKQLIKSAFVFLFFLLVVFSTINAWFPYVTRGHELIILGPLEVIKFYTSISVTLSLGLSLPFICHFLWQFAKPGLLEKEQKFIGLYSPIMLVLFLAGLAFGYFVVNPMSYQFLVGLGEMNFDVMVSASEYVHFLIMTTVPIGLLFELPIVALFLSSIGILTAETMKKVRKWSYISMAVVSAVITPPDFISQLLVLIPMIILYETSVFIIRKTEVRRDALAHQ